MLAPSLALWVDGQTIKLPLCYRPPIVRSETSDSEVVVHNHQIDGPGVLS